MHVSLLLLQFKYINGYETSLQAIMVVVFIFLDWIFVLMYTTIRILGCTRSWSLTPLTVAYNLGLYQIQHTNEQAQHKRTSTASAILFLFLVFHRTPINYLLVNLAIGDMMYAAFIAPEVILTITGNHPGGKGGTVMCKLLTAGILAWVG